MINVLFRLLLTFNATSLLVAIFLIQKKLSISHFLSGSHRFSEMAVLPDIVSYLLYLLLPVLLTWVSVLLSGCLGKDSFKKGQIESIEYANNSFLPSYLGYFFVALSVADWETLRFVYGMLFIFTFLSQALYFNPLFLLFGYEFYNVKTRHGVTLFLISHKKYKKPGDIDIDRVFRINNYTFIERRT